jgi:HPt (histidine-containing phosphotransfer) domain-containing protein
VRRKTAAQRLGEEEILLCFGRLTRKVGAKFKDLVRREKLMATANELASGSECQPSVIDEDHLGRMTLGDRWLEREVLEIFVRQTEIMLGRITASEPALAGPAAHTLMGSARGIGAWRVARAAERLERAASESSDEDVDAAIAELKAAAVEANAVIGSRLGNLSAALVHGC